MGHSVPLFVCVVPSPSGQPPGRLEPLEFCLAHTGVLGLGPWPTVDVPVASAGHERQGRRQGRVAVMQLLLLLEQGAGVQGSDKQIWGRTPAGSGAVPLC